MYEAFAKSCIQNSYLAEKAEPGFIKANNGALNSKILLEKFYMAEEICRDFPNQP